ALRSRVEHGAAAREVDAGLHDDADGGDIAFDPAAILHLQDPEGANVSDDAAADQRFLDLDVGAHHAVLADLEPIAVDDVTLELTIDPQRTRHHEGAANARADPNGGIRGLR